MSNAGMLMNNEEWQEKYTKMSIFYQDRLKYTEDMLAKAMEMNLKLAGMLNNCWRPSFKFKESKE